MVVINQSHGKIIPTFVLNAIANEFHSLDTVMNINRGKYTSLQWYFSHIARVTWLVQGDPNEEETRGVRIHPSFFHFVCKPVFSVLTDGLRKYTRTSDTGWSRTAN